MDTERLERLLADGALGALSEDTAALLAAYVAGDPAAAKTARSYQAAGDLARRVLAGGAAPPAGPLPLRRLRHARRAARWRAAGRAGLLAAACLLIGVLAGGLIVASASRRTPARTGAGLAHARLATARPPDAGTGAFWSVRRLAGPLADTAPQAAARLVWRSPVEPPRWSLNSGDKP